MEAAVLALLLSRRKKAIDRVGDPSGAIVSAVADGIISGRQAARELGRLSIARRFDVAGVVDPLTKLQDAARAQSIARRHLAKVRLAELQARAASDPKPWATALESTEWRVATIAATEVHAAANAERIEAAVEAQAATGVELLKEWNAESDACPQCQELDGETVPVTASFSSGTEPGQAHPSCRCWVEIFARSGRVAA